MVSSSFIILFINNLNRKDETIIENVAHAAGGSDGYEFAVLFKGGNLDC